MTRSAATLVLVGLLASCTPAPPSSPAPWFADEAHARGLDFRHASGATGQFLLPEIMGGGVALIDVDGDGDLDVYLVQSGSLAAASGTDGNNAGNQLYLNQGDGRFVVANTSGAEDTGYGMGVATGDYDNDGDVDIYVTNVGPNVLLRNDGRGQFTNVTAIAGVGDAGFSTAATFIDADTDGDLDLFVVNYVDWSQAIERDCYDYATGIRGYCGPDNYNLPTPDRLYRNNGDGTFTDVSLTAGIHAAQGNGLGVTTADFNGDGRPDIFVANDKTPNLLWLNQGELRFHNEALLWGCAMDDHGMAKAGMGVAAADIDDDGDADLLVVNIEGETDSFFRNEGGYFVDATAAQGLGTLSRRYTRFGIALADLDNDGRFDLYEANGRVTYTPEPESGAADLYAEPNVLFQGQPDGRFSYLAQPTDSHVHTSRGVATGDINGDGGLDLLVVNRDAPPYLLINQVPGRGHSLTFRVLTATGRDAYGAVVSGIANGTRRSRLVQTAGSYLAASDPRVHFGLGKAARLQDVTVVWPDGSSDAFGDFEADQVAVLQAGPRQAGPRQAGPREARPAVRP